MHNIFFSVQYIFNGAGAKLSLEKILGGEHGGARWKPALRNEWGHLDQGNDNGVAAIDTIKSIHYQSIPKENKVTYTSFVYNHITLKDEECHIRLVVGGDKLEFYSDSGSPATDLTETKILLNSIISDTKKAHALQSWI